MDRAQGDTPTAEKWVVRFLRMKNPLPHTLLDSYGNVDFERALFGNVEQPVLPVTNVQKMIIDSEVQEMEAQVSTEVQDKSPSVPEQPATARDE